jgi:hypothetical protein
MSVVAPTALYNRARLAEARAWVRYINIARWAGFLGILCAPFSLCALFWTSPRDYPFLSSMLFVPLVIYGCVILFSRLWRRDRFVRLLFGAGITVRLVAAGVYVWVGFFVFNVSVDAFHYWTTGLVLANEFSGVGWAAFRPPWWSTNLIYNICGIVTLITGNAMPTLFVIFALAGLWGGYFFYRAFCIAFPEWNRGLYGLLVVLLPSILYWSSAIGKDALEQLFIGISAYGFAKVVRRLDFSAILITAVGIAGATMARPHIGAMIATSMLLPFVLTKTKSGWMSVMTKTLLLPVLIGCTYFLVTQAQSFVGAESVDLKSGMHVLEERNINSQSGGSTFNQRESLTKRIIQGPFLPFRPFPWEVHNFMSAAAALEGAGLFFLLWRKRRQCWAVIRKWRDPYVGFILAFALQFSVIFAAASGNFGTLVRQRIMLLPLVLMLFCAKLPAREVVGVPLARRDSWFRTRLPLPHLSR